MKRVVINSPIFSCDAKCTDEAATQLVKTAYAAKSRHIEQNKHKYPVGQVSIDGSVESSEELAAEQVPMLIEICEA